MTPLQRCKAAGCCPLGLALRVKNADCSWPRKPWPDFARAVLRSAGADVVESDCYDIAQAWDSGKRAAAANLAAKLGLI